jgi:LysR family glycine cleavage system transcriptional activator
VPKFRTFVAEIGDTLFWLDRSRVNGAAGIGNAGVIHGPVLNRASMLIDAAVDGHGIALARTTLAAWDLIHKRLVRPFPVALPLSKSFWIVCTKVTADLPKLVAFRDWLLALTRVPVLSENHIRA